MWHQLEVVIATL